MLIIQKKNHTVFRRSDFNLVAQFNVVVISCNWRTQERKMKIVTQNDLPATQIPYPQQLNHLSMVSFTQTKTAQRRACVQIQTFHWTDRWSDQFKSRDATKFRSYNIIQWLTLFDWMERDLSDRCRQLFIALAMIRNRRFPPRNVRSSFKATTDVWIKVTVAASQGQRRLISGQNNNRALKARWQHRSFKPQDIAMLATGATSVQCTAQASRLQECKQLHQLQERKRRRRGGGNIRCHINSD